MIFVHRAGSWDLGERARVVGILNLTPDSFYDGGRHAAPSAALARAEAMAAEGADAIDVGAQSTRPGGIAAIGADAEWERLRPVLPGVVRLGLPVSIDTWRVEVARRALDAGVAIVNDVTGLTAEPAIATEAAAAGAGLVLMHSWSRCADSWRPGCAKPPRPASRPSGSPWTRESDSRSGRDRASACSPDFRA
jgi:dihydropteroate synthase